MYGAVTPPSGWLICDGSAVSRTQYSNLFAIISTTWGIGDGSSTFNLPDLRDCFPIGASASKALTSAGGEATHTLSVAELAAHTHAGVNHLHDLQNHTHLGVDHLHSLQNHTHSYNAFAAVAAGQGYNIQPGGGFYVGNVASSTGGPSTPTTGAADRGLTTAGPSINNTGAADRDLTTSSVGSGVPHNTIPPYRAVNFIIKS
jgi:microcystin-dependent protein